MQRILIGLLIIAAQSAQAEYRAFELLIYNKDTSETRTVVSTLDPLQFKTYYTVHPGEVISYSQTWMCRGNTAERPICPNPKSNLAQDQTPATPSPNN